MDRDGNRILIGLTVYNENLQAIGTLEHPDPNAYPGGALSPDGNSAYTFDNTGTP